MTPFEHQAKIKSQIFGSYHNSSDCLKKSEDEAALDKTKEEDDEKTEEKPEEESK